MMASPTVTLEPGWYDSFERVHYPPVRTCQVCNHEWRVDFVEGEYEGQWDLDTDDECYPCANREEEATDG